MIRAGLAALLAVLGLHAVGQELSDEQWARVKNGEILVEDSVNEQGLSGAKVSFLVKARPEDIWDLLVDHKHERFRKVFPDVQELSEVRQNERGAEVRYWVRHGILSFEYVLQRNYKNSGRRLTWHRVSGSFKAISGEWAIHGSAHKDLQLVVCKSYVDVGFFVPSAWAKDSIARGARRTAERMRGFLQAESR